MDETGQLPGMQAARLHLARYGPVIEVRRGDYTIAAYRKDDLGLRNLAIISLTESGVSGSTAAALFSLTPVQISRIRGQYRQHGSAGLARKQGRPAGLTPGQVRQARSWAGAGVTHGEIARRLAVSRPLITALIGSHGPLYPQDELPGTGQAGGDGNAPQDQPAPHAAEDQPSEDRAAAAGQEQEEEQQEARRYHCQPAAGAYRSRYAGAMLTHAFTTAIGAAGILEGRLRPGRRRRRRGPGRAERDRHGVHPRGADPGADQAPAGARRRAADRPEPAAGPARVAAASGRDRQPGRPAGAAAADDRRAAGPPAPRPSGVPRRRPHRRVHRLQAGWLGPQPPARQGHQGPRRHLRVRPVRPGPGGRQRRAVRTVTDPAARPGPADRSTHGRYRRRQQQPGRPVVVFDRGGSYPKTFKAVHAAGYDWISWRRAPLAATSRLPVLATIRQYGTDRVIAFTNEVIALDGYPEPVRQISLFEHGKMVAQLLTSCLRPCAGALLGLLRSRWIIENFLKYNAANYGIDTLADYTADLADDTRLTANPAYAQAKKAEQAASSALAGAQAALAAMLADPAIPAREKNASLIPAAHKKITACERDLAAATAARKGLRSKIPRNQLRPGAQKALLRPGRRLLQLVLRLLAANAEQHLADHLNVYLHDDDEYRAITRETILRGLGGTITYTAAAITVTLDQPSQPKIARALACLLAEINTRPPVIPGDLRPITYQLAT